MKETNQRLLHTIKWAFRGIGICIAVALVSNSVWASTVDYLDMVASGFTKEGVYPRIVIRNDVGLAGSATFAVPFDAAVGLGDPGQYCSGVLIAPTTVLSARHCFIGTNDQVRFGTSYNSPTFTATVQSVSFPGGGGAGSPFLNGGDVAIVRLNQSVPGSVATPMMLTDETTSLLAQDVAMIGYGNRGVGSTGVTGWDGVRRGGTNVLDHYGQAVNTSTFMSGTSNILSTDFDNPTGTTNTLNWLGSDPAATATEATTAGGDSGGPLLVSVGGQWVVTGVLSGGTTSNSVYGDISWWTGIAPYRAQIEAAGGVFVPEPNFLAFVFLVGLAGLGRRTGRSSRLVVPRESV